MCRSIKTLYNYDPPASEEEIRAASLQFVRKVSGFRKPSKENELSFNQAVDNISSVTENLLKSLMTNAEAKNRKIEAEKARKRFSKRSSQYERTK